MSKIYKRLYEGNESLWEKDIRKYLMRGREFSRDPETLENAIPAILNMMRDIESIAKDSRDVVDYDAQTDEYAYTINYEDNPTIAGLDDDQIDTLWDFVTNYFEPR